MDAIKEGMLATAKAAEAAARVGESLFGAKQEKSVKFKSQICTTREQSQRLLSFGLKKDTADMVWIPEVDFDAEGEPYDTGEYFERPIKGVWDYTLLEGIPAWSLHRLIEMKQPNTIDNAVVVLSREQTYDKLIGMIAKSIKEGKFPKEYLV